MDIVSENRSARFNYFILQEYDAGLVLVGSEVKSLRQRRVNIGDSHVLEKNMELWLHNMHIAEYKMSNNKNHAPMRPRKLLLRRREINKIAGSLKTAGLTVVPLTVFFNDKGLAKVKIAIAKGKKLYDKREAIKAREWNREKSRITKKDI